VQPQDIPQVAKTRALHVYLDALAVKARLEKLPLARE
jgi:hypothetical protein